MAQGDSIVGICNAALIALGEHPITSLTDPTKRAILCGVKYDQVRRELLRMHTWSCAKRLASLAASATAPAFRWGNAYPVPADFIRLWDVEGGVDRDDATWEVSNGLIYTDEDAPLQLEYICDLQDPTQFDPLFSKCLGLSLAVELAEPLTQSGDKLNRVTSRLANIMPDARLASSQDQGPRELDEDVWLRSRH
jgi:hypothetical protein